MMNATPASRHPSLDELCDVISRMLVGRNAAETIAAGIGSEGGGLAVLPMWSWQISAADLGRKDCDPKGGRYLMPLRINYESNATILLAPGEKRVVKWTASGIGLNYSGRLTITCSDIPRIESTTFDPKTGAPKTMHVTPVTKLDLTRRLDHLIELGQSAEWAFRINSEGFLRHEIHNAHTRMASRLGGGEYAALLDEVKLYELCDEMAVGTDTKPGAVANLIGRMLSPGTFARVDPLRYVRVSLRRDAEDAIRAALGDPRTGPALRRWVAENQPRSIEEVIDGWNADHPNDRIARERVIAALTAGPAIVPEMSFEDYMTAGGSR